MGSFEGPSAAELLALHEITMELYLCPDEDSLRRRAVDLARERLGLDDGKREIFILLAGAVARLGVLKRKEEELRVLATTDELTGTVNRRTALIILEKQVGLCERNAAPLALCLADIDGLKRVNDEFGHRVGDEYIRRCCAAIVGAVRGSDTVGRLGGDEFVVVFPDCPFEEAEAIMGRVGRSLDAQAADLPYRPSMSWGIASLGEPGDDSDGLESCAEASPSGRRAEELLEAADRRMYQRKRDRCRPKE